MTEPIDQWRDYYADIGIGSDLSSHYLSFVESCLEKGIPPIFEGRHLQLLLGINQDHFLAMVHSPQSYYRTFSMKKRSGGTRRINAPLPSLLKAQRWIATEILSKAPVSKAATAYGKKSSILQNADLHCDRDFLIKIDIEDFFGSISRSRVISSFRRLGYPTNVSHYLSRLCCLHDALPQGAATSPLLSNVICKEMDDLFYKHCKKYRLRYTRYSDDIAISGKEIPEGLRRFFFEIVENFGFRVNTKKVRFLTPGDKKIVTGIDISNGWPRVPRSFRRELMKDIYFVWSSGLSTHVARERIFAPLYLEQLRGRLQFWKLVEPGNPQMRKCEERLRQIGAC